MGKGREGKITARQGCGLGLETHQRLVSTKKLQRLGLISGG